ALVYDVVSRNDWSLRNKRSRRFQTLYNQILAMPVPDADRGDDLVLWKRDDLPNSHLSYMEKKKLQMPKAIDRSMMNRIVPLKYGLQHRYVGLLQRWFELTVYSS
ncbi:hypothetical protein HID58_047933, partial [Brassica napus]